MGRVAKQISKTGLKKIESFCSLYKDLIIDYDNFYSEFLNIITYDNRYIKECSEKSIIQFYTETADKLFNEYQDLYGKIELDDEFYNKLKYQSRCKLAKKYMPDKYFDNNIDIYFNDVKREYIMHPIGESEDLEFCPENMNIFIKNNLKLVIECAKRYRNLGLPFDDLIQIGNVGLMMAFQKFDNSRANLRFAILDDIKHYKTNEFSFDDAKCIIEKNFAYTKLLDKTLNLIPEDGFANKQEFINWTNKNIKKASFSSVAFQWIRAQIIQELNKHGNIIRIPKSAKDNGYSSANIIRLDSINPHTDDDYHDNQISEIANEEFVIEDESIEKEERRDVFRDILNKVMVSLKVEDRIILKKRFGIDYPFSLSISEIAEQEGLSSNNVKYSIQNSLKTIYDNVTPRNKELILDMLK